jgi:soluble lytic murein transglycosylase
VTKKILVIIAIIIALVVGVMFEREEVLKTAYPTKYNEYVFKYSNEYNIDPYLVFSIIKAESKFDPNAISHKDAKGLMQISPITQEWARKELKLKDVDIYDPKTNIKIGCWYLNRLYMEFKDTSLVIAAYNGGSGNVTKWLKNKEYSKDGNELHVIPFKETANYLEKVQKNHRTYKELYN